MNPLNIPLIVVALCINKTNKCTSGLLVSLQDGCFSDTAAI